MRRKRVLLLVVVLLIGTAAVGTAVFWRQRALDQRAIENRVHGMEAAEIGDHVTTLDQVGRYLQRFGQDDDPEALFAYANARAEIAQPNNKHIPQAIALLRRILETNPGHADAQGKLLKLYLRAGYAQESLGMAEEILARDPANLDALRAEGLVFLQLGDYDAALEKSRIIAKLAPADIENHLRALYLMERIGAGKDALLAYPRSQPAFDEDDPRFQLVLAAAHELAGDDSEAIQWAERSAANATADPALVTALTAYFDRLGRYQTSLDLLARTAGSADNEELRRSLVRRLFEVGAMDAVMAHTAATPLPDQDTTLLALRAIVQAGRGEQADVERITTELANRKNDASARTWAPVLKALWLEEQSADAVAAVCREAVQRDSSNPYFHYFLGVSYERLAETDLANAAWERASILAPGWGEPLLRRARALAAMNRHEDAKKLAIQAVHQAPTNGGVLTAAIEILGSGVNALNAEETSGLLRLVRGLQEANPLEPQTLPVFVELLLRDGEIAAARQQIQAAANADRDLPQETLLELAELSRRHDLGLEDTCYAAVARTHGSTPELVFAQALAAHQNGNTQRGREMLTAAMQNQDDQLAWQLALARYLEQTNDEAATAAWAKLADAAPDNAGIQRFVLQSNLAWRNLDLVKRSIERLKTQAGDKGLTWRVAEARWLLESDRSSKAAAEATMLLTESLPGAIPHARNHIVLATAFERLGNNEAAIENYTKALELEPAGNPIRLELARLLNESGDSAGARRQLDAVLASDTVTPDELQRVAAILAQQNDLDKARELLLQAQAGSDDENAKLLLADVYRRSNLLDEAETVAKGVLAENPTAEAVAFTADLVAAQGRVDEALAILKDLDAVTIEEGRRALILADFHQQYGEAETARRYYEAAVKDSSDDPQVWRRYITFLIRDGETARAVDLIDDARAACPGDEAFAALSLQSSLIQQVASHVQAPRFLVAAMDTPEQSEAAIAALRAIQRYSAEDGAQLAAQFERLANQHPRFLPLKLQLVRLYASLGRQEAAATMAASVMKAFPGEAEPAALAAEANANIGRWAESEAAAKAWRRYSGGTAPLADLTLATAQVEQGRAADALAILQPYVDHAQQGASLDTRMLPLLARALAGTNQAEQAAHVLAPQLASSADFRLAWIRLAVRDLTSADETAQWLERVAPAIPADAAREQVALATAWYGLADRSDNDTYRDRARTLLEHAAALPSADGQAALTLAIINDRERNYAGAEENYRRALAHNPGLAVANNNLAMLLVNQGNAIEDALHFAQEAVAQAPENANYRDTLAQVYASAGDFDAAITALRKAAELEPQEPKWRERLSELQGRRSDEQPS